MTLFDYIWDASSIIHQSSLMIDNLYKKVEGLKRERGDLMLIAKAEAQRVERMNQLEEAKQCLADHIGLLKVVRSNNWNIEDELLLLTRELGWMRTYNSELVEQVVVAK
ncbi:hypothetical protein GW17_00060014 [Ensete ventricosum]|nr:hypothetical protein GW17_00060014 [Ensete ventricosum]